jgi:uncharacterized protein YhdP
MTTGLRSLAGWFARIVTLAILVGGFALWRLSSGPVVLDALVPYLEPYLDDVAGDLRIGVGGLEVGLAEDRARVELRFRDVRVRNAGGVKAAFPTVGVAFSPRALLEGRLRPVRLDLHRPRIVLTRDRQGHLSMASGEGAAMGAGTLPLVDVMLRPPSDEHFLGRLERVTVAGADVTLIDRRDDRRLHAANAALALTRAEGEVDGRATLAVDAGSGAIAVEIAGRHHADRTTDVTIRLPGLRPARLAEFDGRLAALAGVEANADLTAKTTLDPDLSFRTAAIAFNAADVRVQAEGLAPVAVDRMRLEGDYDAGSGVVTFRATEIGRPGFELSGQGTFDTERQRGHWDFALENGRIALDADAEGDGVRLAAVLTRLDPRVFAALSADAEALSGFDLPLTGTVAAAFGPGFVPRTALIDLSNTGGTAFWPGRLNGTLRVASLSARIAADATDRTLRLERFDLAFEDMMSGPALSVSGTVRDDGKTFGLDLAASVARMPLDSLAHYWPAGAKANAREWITGNLSRGSVDAFAVRVSGTAPSGHLEDFDLSRLGGELQGHGASVRYFKDLPPVEGVDRVEGTFHGRTLTIKTHGGAIGDVKAGEGTITIVNLGTPREDIDIRIPVQGPLRTALEVLDSNSLGYPSRLGIETKRVKGEASADLRFAFPLFANLALSDVIIEVGAKFNGLAIEGIAGGRDVTDGALTMTLDTQSMQTKGKAKIAGLPVTLDWRELFAPQGKDPRTRIVARGRIDPAMAAKAGLTLPPGVSGSADLTAVLTVDQADKRVLSGTLDLEKARLSFPPLGWRKAEGVGGTAKFALAVPAKKGTPVAIDLSASAAGLEASALVTLDAEGGVQTIKGARVVHGKSDFAVDAVRDGDLYRATLSGRSVDARPTMEDAGDDSRPIPPMDLTVNVDRVVFGEGRELGAVQGKLRRTGDRWTFFDLVAHDGSGAGLTARLRPEGTGGAFQVAAENAGTALESLDITNRVRGGRLTAAGQVAADKDATVNGTIEMTAYTLLDAPVLGRILNAMSLSGLVDLLRGEGLGFQRLDGAFKRVGPLITLQGLRTAGGALGLTLDGDLDLKRDRVALRGTIVPIYGLNRIIGQIPILGDILSGGEGQGIFAATWDVSGSIGDPSVSVNPLAVLAPGFLRNLFFLGSAPTTVGNRPPP